MLYDFIQFLLKIGDQGYLGSRSSDKLSPEGKVFDEDCREITIKGCIAVLVNLGASTKSEGLSLKHDAFGMLLCIEGDHIFPPSEMAVFQ